MRGEMRRTNRNEYNDYDCSRQRQRDSKTAGMLRPEKIDQAHDQQHANGGECDVVAQHFDPFHVLRAGGDIRKRGPTAQRRRHCEIGQQQ